MLSSALTVIAASRGPADLGTSTTPTIRVGPPETGPDTVPVSSRSTRQPAGTVSWNR